MSCDIDTGAKNEALSVDDSVELAVSRWSAWAPNIETVESWHQWLDGERPIEGPVTPDVRDVPALLRRRLSEVSRMAFKVSADCFGDDDTETAYIFCSRYGEYSRSFQIMLGIAREEAVSPAAFSMSVHNTAASQWSIHRHDQSPSTALAAGDATLEGAFVEAWSQLREGVAQSALIVYHDQPLPDLYAPQNRSVTQSIALGVRVCLPGEGRPDPALRLSWAPSAQSIALRPAADPALGLVSLLLGGDPVTRDAGRLTWRWIKINANS